MQHHINAEWLGLLESVLNYGEDVRPRDYPTRELLGFQTRVDMNNPVITIGERQLGYRFLAAEAAWILSGDNRVATIKPYSRAIAQFSDDGLTFRGAYGPKVVDQLSWVAETLAADPSSRQAVLNIWRERPGSSRDVPCTLSLQFLIRNRRLNTIATMRSSDAWLGWVYDVFNFSMISAYLTLMLRDALEGTTLGELTLTAGSQHLYNRDHEPARRCIESGDAAFVVAPLDLSEFDEPQELIDHLWEVANHAQGGKGYNWLKELINR